MLKPWQSPRKRQQIPPDGGTCACNRHKTQGVAKEPATTRQRWPLKDCAASTDHNSRKLQSQSTTILERRYHTILKVEDWPELFLHTRKTPKNLCGQHIVTMFSDYLRSSQRGAEGARSPGGGGGSVPGYILLLSGSQDQSVGWALLVFTA